MQFKDVAHEIISGLWLGSEDAACLPLEELRDKNIVAVLSVGKGLAAPHIQDLVYLCIPAYDIPGFALLPYFPECAEFIASNIQNGSVLIHCAQGVSRSATVTIAYIMKSQHKNRKDAEWMVRQRRKIISPKTSFLEQLDIWEKLGYSLEEADNPSAEHAQAFLDYEKQYKAKLQLRSNIRK